MHLFLFLDTTMDLHFCSLKVRRFVLHQALRELMSSCKFVVISRSNGPIEKDVICIEQQLTPM